MLYWCLFFFGVCIRIQDRFIICIIWTLYKRIFNMFVIWSISTVVMILNLMNYQMNPLALINDTFRNYQYMTCLFKLIVVCLFEILMTKSLDRDVFFLVIILTHLMKSFLNGVIYFCTNCPLNNWYFPPLTCKIEHGDETIIIL